MRRRSVKHAKERLIQASGLVVFEPNNYKGHWHELFGNDNPIHVEIGMGKGKFIIAHALKEPDVNFIGIEMYDSVIVQATEKIKDVMISNLHLINADASTLPEMFDQGEIDKIYLNFSDPWPKNRHEKRRLTSSRFLNIYEQIFKGEIEFKTDNRGLFEFSLMSFNQNNYDFLDVSLDLHTREEEIITTEYEEKFMAKGNPIYYIKVKKANL